MPIYEYRCQRCDTVSDVFHRRMNEPKPVCPACGEDALERLISRTHFKLKGSGWYVTDYASSGSKNEPNAAESSASSTDNSSDSSSESSADTAVGSRGELSTRTRSETSSSSSTSTAASA